MFRPPSKRRPVLPRSHPIHHPYPAVGGSVRLLKWLFRVPVHENVRSAEILIGHDTVRLYAEYTSTVAGGVQDFMVL